LRVTAGQRDSNSNETFPIMDPVNLRGTNAGSFTLSEMKPRAEAAKAGHSIVHFSIHALPAAKGGVNEVARQDL
jgi:hypothetical protein